MKSASGFVRSATILLSGTVLAQGITFAAALALARLFDETAFGHFAAFTSVLAILVILSTGSYDKALMFAGSQRRFHSLVLIVLGLAIALTSFSLLVGTIAISVGVVLPGAFGRIDQLLSLSLATIGFACGQVFIFMALRAKRNSHVAATKVGQSAVTATAQLGLGELGARFGLSIGHALGWALFIPLVYLQLRRGGLRLTRRMLLAVRSSLRRFAAYPRYVCVNELFDSLSQQIPLILIATLISIETLGHYSFSYRLMAGPSALLGQAVSQSFLQRIGGGLFDPVAIRALLLRVWRTLLLLAIVPFGIMGIWGEEIFVLLFGTNWAEAGRISAASTPLLLARFVSSPTSPIVYRLELQRQQFFLSILMIVARSAPIALAMGGATIYQVIAVQSVGEIGVIIAFNLTALRALASRRRGPTPIKPSAPHV
jgi:O-antigen/teichoic acid export membrane protein